MKKIRGSCPFCRTARGVFCLFKHTQTYYYYRCHKYGKISELPTEYQPDQSFRNFEFKYSNKKEVLEDVKLPRNFKAIEPNSMGWKYLTRRNIKCVPLKPFVGESDNYVVFPFYDRGKLTYHVSRKIYGAGLRYRAAESSGHDKLFIPYQLPLDNKNLIICEGIFDCLRVYQTTKIPTIALYGKHINSGKILSILNYSKENVYILLDPEAKDPETVSAKIKISEDLRTFRNVYTLEYLSGETRDPGDMDDETILDITAVVRSGL